MKKTFIDHHGYNIETTTISKVQLKELKNELTVVPKNNFLNDDNDEETQYQVYSEKNNIITVPKYYGLDKFGEPEKYKFNPSKVDIQFTGNLRDYQLEIIDKCMIHIKQKGGGLLVVPCGMGKCLGIDTPVMMYDGSIKLVQDIVVGDKLMGDDSTPRNVLSVCQGREKMYDVGNFICNKSHILSLKWMNQDSFQEHPCGETINISVEDYLKFNASQYLKGYCVGVEFPNKPVKYDPYMFGYYIAKKFNHICDSFELTSIQHNLYEFSNIERIPDEYKYNSKNVRLKLLSGFVDSVGIPKDLTFILKLDVHLYNDILFIIRSLGINYDYFNETSLIIPINFFELNEYTTYNICVKPIGIDDYYGFEIDKNGLFLLGDFTVTHNTTMSIYMASLLGYKTLVITHKTFLQDQWIARCKQFTKSSVGIIRQSKVDIEGHDFVIAMIQSLCKREYPEDIFKQFALVIADECIEKDERIITNNGNIKISNLYNLWKSNSELPLIKSFNEDTQEFEFKKLTYAWKKKAKNIVQVVFHKQKKITCTSDHKFLTLDGYVEAKNLKGKILVGITDKTMTHCHYAQQLNDDQEQILLGSFLGDGCIRIKKNSRYSLTIIHGIVQQDYCKWKASMFNAHVTYIEKNGYAQKPAVSFNTKVFDYPYDFPKTKKTCPQWLIDKIDFRAIAIWIMDDGSINKKSPTIRISTCSFDEDSQKRLVKKLNEMGIDCKYIFNVGYYYIYINENGTKFLTSNIYKYMHKNILYKLQTKQFNEYIELYNKPYSKDIIYNTICNIPESHLKCNNNYLVKTSETIRKYTYKYCNKCENNEFCVANNYICKRNKQSYSYLKCCKCMNKRPIFRYSFNPIEQYKWNNQFKNISTCKVTDVIVLDTGIDVYDIEVEDNHNFIIGSKKSPNKQYGTIVHNCHHFSSKQFSKALAKTGSKYTIGLSATPYRSDGLIKVVKWYLGDIMYRKKLATNNQVIAKILTFYSDHMLFQEKQRYIKTSIKPDSVQMITNLTLLKERNAHIINIINEIRQDPERKILILSGRKAHLKLLKDSIDKSIQDDIDSKKMLENEITTCYYTGDATKEERQLAEQKGDILFGTYDMAHEGLDIDRLNTIVLASPKKDVIQAIGRILRKVLKDGDLRPLIIDIVDNLSIFKSQAKKREDFYNKSKYLQHYYYCYEHNLVSPYRYLEAINEKNEKANKEVPTYKDILDIPPVEIMDEVACDAKKKESKPKKKCGYFS